MEAVRVGAQKGHDLQFGTKRSMYSSFHLVEIFILCHYLITRRIHTAKHLLQCAGFEANRVVRLRWPIRFRITRTVSSLFERSAEKNDVKYMCECSTSLI